jgi:hypothetical protein
MGCGPWRMDGRWAKYALASALPGWAESAKSGLRVGSARSGSHRGRAGSGRWGCAYCGALCGQDGGPVELGYSRIQHSLELGLRAEPPAVQQLSRGRCCRPPREEASGRD